MTPRHRAVPGGNFGTAARPRAPQAHMAPRPNDGDAKLSAAYITSALRPEPRKLLEKRLKGVGLAKAAPHAAPPDDEVSDAICATEWDLSLNTLFDKQTVNRKGPDPGERGNADAHVALWKQCANATGDAPLLILEDDVLLCDRFGAMTDVLIGLVEKLQTEPAERSTLLYLSGHPELAEQWVPTGIIDPNGREVILREAAYVWGTEGYVIWPQAARRLLENLPLTCPVDIFLGRHLYQHKLRALVCQPLPAMKRPTDVVEQPHVPGSSLQARPPAVVARYTVVHKPRVAARKKPTDDGMVVGAYAAGQTLDAIGHSADGQWAQLAPLEWVAIKHPTYGTLLELEPPEPEEPEEPED